MKNVLIFVAVCLIGVGVYFGFIHKPPVQRAGDEVEIIPGIKARFTRNEDAGKYYGPMLKSFIRRSPGDNVPKSLSEDERRSFMFGTSCRKCELYPAQFPHIMPYAPMPELRAAKRIADVALDSAQTLWREGRDGEALDILKKIAVLGWHVEQQNETVVANLAGVAIQWVAYRGLSQFYSSREGTEKAREYREHIEARRKSLRSFLELPSDIKTWSEFEVLKKTALNHSEASWRKEACLEFTAPFVRADAQARAQAVQILTTISREDSDPVVRQFAAACIPYVDGTKKVPPPTR